jgi:hypothetical protein
MDGNYYLVADGRGLNLENRAKAKAEDYSDGRGWVDLEAHRDDIRTVFLSTDGRYALSGSDDTTLKLWAIDWELEDRCPADWDEGARPHLDIFLCQQIPYAGSLPADRQPTPEEVTRALTRCGQPQWTEADFERLMRLIGCAGYGWLRAEGVRRELEKMAANWQGPPPLG